MPQAAVLTTMIALVITTISPWQTPQRRLLAVSGASAAAATLVHTLGGELGAAAAQVTPTLFLVGGYAALSGVLAASGLTEVVASRLGNGPLPVLAAAAAMSIFLSNDIVIVVLAPVLLLRSDRTSDAAALLVGANVTGSLLPQGTPKNLLLTGNIPFSEYLTVSIAPTLMLTLAALSVFGVLQLTRREHRPSLIPPAKQPLTRAHRLLTPIALAALAAQPAAAAFGLSRTLLGTFLLALSGTLAIKLRIGAVHALRAVPWSLAPLVIILAAGAPLISSPAAGAPGGELVNVALTFLVSATTTDLLGAALAAPYIQLGTLSAQLGLAATTAAAYATPIGSVSAILLIQAWRTFPTTPPAAGEHPDNRRFPFEVFALSAGTALVGLTATTAAHLLRAAL